MIEQITYAQLIKRHGPARIVKNPPKIFVAGWIGVLGEHNRDMPLPHAEHPLMAKTSLTSDTLDFGFILCSAGANANDQFFVEDEISVPEIYNSVIGEPLNEDHEQTFRAIVGNINESSFITAAGEVPASIYCRGNIFADIYPAVAKKVRLGAGRWAAVSMEAIPNPLEMVGKYLIIHMPKFVGAGLVRFPANAYSQIDEVDGSPVGGISPHNASMAKSLQLAVRSLFA